MDPLSIRIGRWLGSLAAVGVGHAFAQAGDIAGERTAPTWMDPGSQRAQRLGAPPAQFERNPIYPVPIVLEGRLGLGLVFAPAPARSCDLAPSPPAVVQVGALLRNRLVLRGDETLDSGFAAHFRLDHSLRPDTGESNDACGRFWDGESTVGVSRRHVGRVDLGRRPQPAALMSLEADPWGSDGVASAWQKWYLPPVATTEFRASQSVTVGTSRDGPDWLWAEFQVGASQAPGADVPPGARRSGGSINYRRGPWFGGVGWQYWPGGLGSVPAVASYDAGTWKLSLGIAAVRAPERNATNLMLGLSCPVMDRGDPTRQLWRLGFGRYRANDGVESKLAAGWRYAFSRRTALLVNGALVRHPDGGHGGLYEIGISHAFSRDLRVPQEPR
jgi:predicted porin